MFTQVLAWLADKVEFGEVVQGPPSFTVQPKNETTQSKVRR